MKRSTVKMAAIASLALAVPLLAGCVPVSKTGGAGGGSTSQANSLHTPLTCTTDFSEDQLMAYKAPKADKPYEITMMMVSLAGYYYQGLVYGAQQAAKDAGVTVKIVAGNGFTSPAPQLSQAQDVIQSKPDAIALQPVDVQGSVPIVTQANAAGIPVISFGTELDTDQTAGQILQDDYKLGQAGADQLAKAHPEGGEGILIAGPATATWSKKRVAGFEDQLKAKYPKFTVVASPTQPVDPSQGLKDFNDATQAHPDVKWVYSVFFYQLLPDSLPDKYKGIPFVTTGYEPAAITSLESGALTTTASVQNISLGYQAVAQAVEALNSGKGAKAHLGNICVPAPALSKADIGSPVADFDLYPEGFSYKG
jgi:ribose transport system substrate-binding protein